MWKRRVAVMTWTKETMAGRSYTLTSSGSPLTKACFVPCWEWGLSSSLLQQVSFQHGWLWLRKFRSSVRDHDLNWSGLFSESCIWWLWRFFIPTGIIIMALLGMFNVHHHGSINSAAIVLYALTSCVSGYVSCSFYTQINGQRWVWNIILTSSLFSGENSNMSGALSLHVISSLQYLLICWGPNSIKTCVSDLKLLVRNFTNFVTRFSLITSAIHHFCSTTECKWWWKG